MARAARRQVRTEVRPDDISVTGEMRRLPQPFAGRWAYVPERLLAEWSEAGLSDGALFLYLAMVALATVQNPARTDRDRRHIQAPPGGWEAALGLAGRRVRQYRAELRAAGLILETGNGRWRLEYDHRWMAPDMPRCAVPLDHWSTFPGARQVGAARLWAALCRYASAGWHLGGTATVFARSGASGGGHGHPQARHGDGALA